MAVSFPDQVLCGEWQNLTTPRFTFSNNAWNQDLSNGGGSCLNVTNNATSFASTWQWTNTSNENMVHAFPNVNLNSIQQSPVNLSIFTGIDVDIEWSMHPSVLTTATSFDASALEGVDAVANVAFDMFLDPSPKKATSTSSPAYEVMIWLGTIGTIYPIGYNSSSLKSPRPTITKGNTSTVFTLYDGPNDSGQEVFTWITATNITTFEGDISPAVIYLYENGLMPVDNFLGVVQFGTETLHAESYVTFEASKVKIEVNVNVSTDSTTKKSEGVAIGGWRSGGWGWALGMGIMVVVVGGFL